MRVRAASPRHALPSPVNAPAITPTSGQPANIETRNAAAYAAFASSPGRKKFSALPLVVATNAANPTPTIPDTTLRGDSRRTRRAIAKPSAMTTATPADTRTSDPDAVYATTNATAGSDVSAMPMGPPRVSAIPGRSGAMEVLLEHARVDHHRGEQHREVGEREQVA